MYLTIHDIGTQHIFITRHASIWNLTVGFEECNERLILENYGYNQTVGFRERHGQSLVKSWSNPVKLNGWSQDHWTW